MSIKRKALSLAASVALLATLLTTAGVALAANTNGLLSTTSCVPGCNTQIAGAGSILQINGTGAATNIAPQSSATVMLQASAGASIVGSTGSFTYRSSAVVDTGISYLANTATLAAGGAITATGTVLVSATAAGTYTITEYVWSTTLLTWLPDGNTYSYTFVSAASIQVSAANSTAATYATCPSTTATKSGPAAVAATPVAHLCVTVKDGNGTLVSNASVTGTITPIGLASIGAGTLGQSYSGTTAAGVIDVSIWGSGLPGNATITVNVTYLGVTTALPSVTFTFTGTPSSLSIANYLAYTAAGGGSGADAFIVKATDAAGNTTEVTLPAVSLTSTPAGLTFAADSTSTHTTVAATCPAGTTETAYKVNASMASPSLATATPAVFYCNVGKVAKITVTPASSAIPAGGSTTVDIMVTDAAGNPAADDTAILGVASAGALLGDGTSGTAGAVILGGAATFYYFAQNNNGPITLSFLNGATGVTGSGTITVGGAAPGTSSCTNASALGANATSGFSTSTKIAALGKYQTFKISCGAAAAGQTVGILVATKAADGTWSAFTRLTGRVADASGTAIFNWRSSSASWVSVRGDLGGGLSNAVQGRWR